MSDIETSKTIEYLKHVFSEQEKRELADQIDNAIDTKVLVGNIHVPAEKKPRKKRTRKVKVVESPPPTILPDADASNPFYGKKKREKKEVIE